jgi:hypothetical protein
MKSGRTVFRLHAFHGMRRLVTKLPLATHK